MSFVRFVIRADDEDSGRRQGLFQAIAALEDDNALLEHEQTLADETRKWFGRHLEAPSRPAKSSKRHAKKVALSWFRDTAREHIARMHALAHVLECHGIHVEIIRTDRPGYVVYEDAHQIAAEPFNDSGA